MARSGLAVQLGSAPFARWSGNGLKGISIGRALRPINMHETDVHHRPKNAGPVISLSAGTGPATFRWGE